MKEFTRKDVTSARSGNGLDVIYLDYKKDLIVDELPWQKLGLQQTSSGYGAKLTSRYKIHFEGRKYRIYVTIYGNAGSSWFKHKGKKIFIN
jgi:hypothetical protein